MTRLAILVAALLLFSLARLQAQEPGPVAEGVKLQLASLNARDKAEAEWRRLQKSFPDLLGSLSLILQSADLGDRGVFYRVQTAYFPNRATAVDLCAQLKARGQGCLVVGK